MKVVNLYGDEWDEGRWPLHPGYEKKMLGVGSRLAGEKVGATLYELPPGMKSFPYHWHRGLEEMLIVLDGRPTLRTPDGERQLERGDMVSFPSRPEGAHKIWNDTDEPVRYLMLSTVVDYEVVHYPDSDKIGIRAADFSLLVRPESGVDYMDGED
ncbi:MAG: cupin domain-containing protein [Gaiellaceae bacterium]